VGNAQLSMHSIRETGGAYDVEHAVCFVFFANSIGKRVSTFHPVDTPKTWR